MSLRHEDFVSHGHEGVAHHGRPAGEQCEKIFDQEMMCDDMEFEEGDCNMWMILWFVVMLPREVS